MNHLINHSDPFKQTRLLAVLLAVFLLPQGMWAERKTYTFTGSTITSNTTTTTNDINFQSAEGTTWILSGATYSNGLKFGVGSSSSGTSFMGATLTSVDEFHFVNKIIFNIDLSEEAIQFANDRWVKFRCDQTEKEVNMTTLNMDPDEEGVVLEVNYWPNGPLTIYIEGYGYEITLNSITVEYEKGNRWPGLTFHLGQMVFDQWDIYWSESDQEDKLPRLGYVFDPQNYVVVDLYENDIHEFNYTSSNQRVATIDENGKITVYGTGTTTINASYPGDSERYASASASCVLTVVKEYDLWINDIQVTDKNCSDILSNGDATQGKVASFQYIPNLNKLFITNHTDWVRIVTNDDEGLTIYLAPNSDNTIGEIIYGGKRDAPLTITTDGNYPGTITLSANNNVISGFSSLTLEQNLVITTDPEDITYDTRNRVLETTHATIGVPLSPITKEKTIIPNGTELQPEPGSDDINKVVDDILYTLGNANSSDGDGYDTDDDGSGFIVINSVTTDQQAAEAAQNYAPGTAEYLERFKGLTFMVPAGKGKVTFDVQTLNGYAMKVMVGDAVPVIVENAEKGIVEIPYNVAEPTYVYVWNAGKSDDANNARSIHKGKMTTVHIKINGTSVKPNQVKPSNSAAQASGGEYNGDVSGLEGQELETIEEIEASKGDVNGDETSNVADIVGIANAIRGEHSTTYDKRAADVDDNNVINADDIVRLVEKMMGQ